MLSIIYVKYNLFISFNVLIETTSIGIFNLVPNRLDRLDLVDSLSNKRKTTSEITYHLNLLGHLKVRTKAPHTIKDINMGLLKYQRR